MPGETVSPTRTADISEIESLRLEAIRKRVLGREWAGSSVHDFVKAAAKLHAQTLPTASHPDTTTLAEDMLALGDHIGIAADVAAASVHVAGSERLELATEIADVDAQVSQEEVHVQRLRKALARERKQAERRKQYEALAGIVLREPEPIESQKHLDLVNKELEEVEREMARIDETKDAMSKELSLFLHCAAHLDSFSTHFATLLVEEEGEVAMDMSS